MSLSFSSTYLLPDTPTTRRFDSCVSSVFNKQGQAQPEDMVENDVTYATPSTPSAIQVDGSPEPHSSQGLSADTTFGKRRRRAAKLARFFGVGYQDISSSMNAELFSSAEPSATRVQVNVKVNGRSRFLGFSHGQAHLKDGDMIDVEGKLRALKAA
jgi:hypothetical protein